jgi:hypothetical protein
MLGPVPLAALRASTVLRILAALFVCLIVADVAAEGHCDERLAPSRSVLTFSNSTTAPTDACGQVCVPDCYCCAGGVEHATVVVLTGAGRAERAAESAPPSAPDGVRPCPYHPPLLVA